MNRLMVAALFAFGSSALVVALLCFKRLAVRFLDQPNERSLHTRAVPRSGGIGILLGVSLGLAFERDWKVLGCLLALALVSLWDEFRPLPIGVRLLAHLAVSAGFLVFATSIRNPIALVVLTLALTWGTNLYNFMDGMDGLAGGMAVIGFSAYAWLASQVPSGRCIAVVSLCAAGASLGFLLLNFPPARIFMGDSGSITLGFLMGALGLLGWREQLWPVWFPVIVFSLFGADATLTLLRRILKREAFWRAHRSHYYQRLVLLGWSHRRTLLGAYALMLLSTACAFAALQVSWKKGLVCLGFAAGITLLALLVIDRAWSRRKPLVSEHSS
jgi:UDP-GlcNAc:undecaprenyl-phosphate/decaprenyl-phosphate GlcNAc-1-phosphate transferase